MTSKAEYWYQFDIGLNKLLNKVVLPVTWNGNGAHVTSL